MDHTYWHRQTKDEPLYPDLLWSRPENKRLAGKLLIVGGSIHSFAAPARAYTEASAAGVGTSRVVLPDCLSKTVSKLFPEAEYAPSTPSGSFNQQSVAELCDLAAWADGTLLAGDLGRNSETAVMIEQFVHKYSGQLTLAQDSLDYFSTQPSAILGRQNTLLVPSFSQLQKLASGQHPKALTSKLDFMHLVEWLHEFTTVYPIAIMLPYDETVFVAAGGEVSTTKSPENDHVKLASHAATWWLQNPQQFFEGLSTSLVDS